MKSRGPKATLSGSGIVVTLEYYKGNSLAVKYSLELKLIELDIEDVSFATDQMKHHLEVGITGYESYDYSTKRRLFVSLGLIFRIYYKRACLGCKGQLRAYFRHLKRGLKYSFEFGNSSDGVGFRGFCWAFGRGVRLLIEHWNA
ncbi:Uncharacterized protein Adt_12210 [Abeliophyllum distichum]|uniref:Uncharacterized protein n=1 Tax=Abeliophyllum distichum TaxID=126358 RepID=A0ABD1UQ35_9LAMI